MGVITILCLIVEIEILLASFLNTKLITEKSKHIPTTDI